MEGLDIQEVKKQIQGRLAAATFQELVEDMAEKCYNTCIKKPGTALDNYEQRCLTNCMERYIDSYNVISKAFTDRIASQMNES